MSGADNDRAPTREASAVRPGAPGAALSAQRRSEFIDVRVIVHSGRDAAALGRALEALRAAAERGAHVEWSAEALGGLGSRATAALDGRHRFVKRTAPALPRPFELRVSGDVECGPETIDSMRRALARWGVGMACMARAIDPSGRPVPEAGLSAEGSLAWMARRVDLLGDRTITARTLAEPAVLVSRPDGPLHPVQSPGAPRADVHRVGASGVH